MPKQKSNKSAAKRLRRNAGGKWKRAHAFSSHLMSSKTRKQKRQLRRNGEVTAADKKQVRRMLPYA
ncbi:MAG TPA: 50S ribosomal protein L35 [bacterium]|nr:50S ribosomal protein L35 [bacterium]